MSAKMLIGIITTECYSEYQSELMRGVISQAFKSNCDLAVISSMQNFYFHSTHKYTEKKIFELILSENFDGFIYDRNVFQNEEIQKYIDKLCTQSGKPVMLLDYAGHTKFETTMADDIDAFEAVTDHLIDVHGYKKIYCLTGPKGIACSEERLKGYLRSMKKHHIPIDKSYYYYGDFWTSAAAELAQKIFNGNLEKPDAIVCGNDASAISLTERLINAGYRVPEDIAVAGYDASMEGYRATPSITSYIRPNFQLGADAFRRLYRIITGRICSKVPDVPGQLRVGKSCGCTENPTLKRDILRRLKTNDEFQTKMFFSDMLVDITNINSIAELANRIDHFTYLLYKMSRIYICLTDKYRRSVTENPSEELSFSSKDTVLTVFDKSAVQRNQADYISRSSFDQINAIRFEKKQPSAIFITPLQYNENFFGYTAVSFGKNPITYGRLYLQWITYLNIALEKVRIQSAMRLTVDKLDLASGYDPVTGLMNINMLRSKYIEKLNSLSSQLNTVTYLHIELPELKKSYYQLGQESSVNIIRFFTDAVKACITQEELCFALSPDCYGVLFFNKDITDSFFTSLKAAVCTPSPKDNASHDTPFTIGSYTYSAADSDMSLDEIIHKAAVNRIYSHSKSENHTNPHFEKLCQLRNSLVKSPEFSWNIGEIAEKMFISKSYLQKIYKATFGKSIIEELIQFRLDKAKELLLNTDFTVSDIAKECGYSTYNYFVRQFKTAENLSPSEFRELNKN